MIFQVGVRGNGQGWMAGYILYYRNTAEAPFICWDGCNMISANNNRDTVSWLRLYHPIVATEVRIYPVRWVGMMGLQVDLSLLTF